MNRGLEHLSHENRLKELGEEKAPRRPYSCLPVPKGGLQDRWRGSFYQECSERTRGNGFKLKNFRFGLYIRKKFFIVRVMRTLNRLSTESVASLEVLQGQAEWD